MKYSTKNLKNLLIQCSELNLTIANILNSGGSMSESKETKTEVTTAAEASVDGKVEAPSAEAGAAEASVVAEVAVVETEKTPEEASASEVVKEEEAVVVAAETAEAAMVTQETVVVERVAVSDHENGVYAEHRTTSETVVTQHVESEKKSDASEEVAVVTAVASDPFAEKFTTEKASTLGLSETEASLAVGLSFVDLVKVVASLTQEVVQYREKAQAAELQRATEARVDELKQLNVPLDLSEGSADRERITGMDDVAFAAYRDGIRLVSKTVASAPEVKNDKTVEKAKASLKDLAVNVPLVKDNKKSKFAQI